MRDFFEAGGWGMWPILIFGVLLLASAMGWVARRTRRLALLTQLLAAATLTAGLLGVVAGFRTTFNAAAHYAEPDRIKIVLLGMSESMSNLIFALMFLALASLIAIAGALRQPQAQPAIEQRTA